jgi:hypothetical protein
VLGHGEVAGGGSVEVVDEEAGDLAGEDDDLDVGSLPSPRTMSCSVTTVSGITRFAGGFANVILAVRGVVRSRRMVLGWLIGWLRFAGGLGRGRV